jgi:hypothetical protein
MKMWMGTGGAEKYFFPLRRLIRQQPYFSAQNDRAPFVCCKDRKSHVRAPLRRLPPPQKLVIKRNQFTGTGASIEAGNTIEERRRTKFKKDISTKNTGIFFQIVEKRSKRKEMSEKEGKKDARKTQERCKERAQKE